jgi:hypothetical protein
VLALTLVGLLGSRSSAITAVLAWQLVLSPLVAGSPHSGSHAN